MLGQRRRRWANINPALVECIVSCEDLRAIRMKHNRRPSFEYLPVHGLFQDLLTLIVWESSLEVV